VSFIDFAGIGVVDDQQRQLSAAGITLRTVAASPAVQRAFELDAWLIRRPRQHPTVPPLPAS
jgi:hypothetical protein